MTYRTRVATSVCRVAVISALVLGALTPSRTGFAQEVEQVQPAPAPLVLQSRGSFIVGGESVQQTPAQLSYFTGQLPDSGGHATTNQMYVEYMVPLADNGVPVIMLHGATLTGKSYDTTPDGRMGWYEYFVRGGARPCGCLHSIKTDAAGRVPDQCVRHWSRLAVAAHLDDDRRRAGAAGRRRC
jgi:hypothetical protein